MSEFITVKQVIDWGEKAFNDSQLYFGHGTDNAWDEAFWLVFFVLQLPFDSEPGVLDKQLKDAEAKKIMALFSRRIEQRVPAAYLTGEAWFAGMAFYVNQNVLVPRSPIAELIEDQFHPWLTVAPKTMLDLCAGSGCIGISTAMTINELRVDLSDISTLALDVANSNIERYDLSARANTIESDAFEKINKRYDLIVSNPPYVDDQDIAGMPQEYHAEPAIGLASGADGLDFTRQILRESVEYLTDDGHLIVEVGNSGEALEKAYPNVPFMWLEFVRGGHGVFLLSTKQLIEYADDFKR